MHSELFWLFIGLAALAAVVLAAIRLRPSGLSFGLWLVLSAARAIATFADWWTGLGEAADAFAVTFIAASRSKRDELHVERFINKEIKEAGDAETKTRVEAEIG